MRNTTSRHCLSAIGPSSSSGQSSSSSVYNIITSTVITVVTPAQCVTTFGGVCDVRTDSNNLNDFLLGTDTPDREKWRYVNPNPIPPLKTFTQYIFDKPEKYNKIIFRFFIFSNTKFAHFNKLNINCNMTTRVGGFFLYFKHTPTVVTSYITLYLFIFKLNNGMFFILWYLYYDHWSLSREIFTTFYT